ncbi:growth-regulating factor 4-like [Cornus florida]|uniref:growth-regulating factor 4-like n=1 Tax=Cornus florida TaxID=4283 RepID=UPI00289DEA7C|nr:growth-regulating factor 4-like [Cornus florida]
MDFHLKQWKNQQQQQQHESEDQPCAKLPTRLPLFDTHQLLQQQQQQQQQASEPESDSPPALSLPLPFFVPQLTTKLTNMSAFTPAEHSTTTTSATRSFPTRMGSYFSWGQWQELELQGMIFRHMLAGASIPPELLHLLHNSLLNSTTTTTTPPPYYLHYPPRHYQPSLLQSGYWGRGAMDPEPGRCRRTDGKKWRCSRDVVAGHKYCERHMHRGRNRSRKPVEIPTPTTAANGGGGGSGGLLKNNTLIPAAMTGGTHLALSGPSPSIDLLHLNQRPSEPKTENKYPFELKHEMSGDANSGNQVLRHFFDDWPRSLKEPAESNASTVTSSATSLSISTASPQSDFSLKLSTGNRDEPGPEDRNAEQERPQFNWSAGWDANRVAPMGGPLGEALRSSNSSPTSVLHQLQRNSTSETSYITT